jgi:protein-S-isoprenylcysteine O-methyltransferase Ste14
VVAFADRSANWLGKKMSLPPNDEESPPPRGLRIVSFSLHAARGLVRDQTMRRKAMFWTVIVAVVMLFLGSMVLAPVLDPRSHPARFILYWLACVWVTVTAVLLAIFDLLLVRAQTRKQRRDLKENLTQPDMSDDAD